MRDPQDLRRLREAFRSSDEAGKSPDSAPAAEEIFDVARGEAEELTKQRVVDDLATRPEAALEWDLARALLEEAGVSENPPQRAQQRPVAWLVAAATLFVVAGLSYVLLRDAPPEPVYRSGKTRQIEALLPPEGRCLSSLPCRLSWTSEEGDSRFLLRIQSLDLEPVVEVELSQPEYTLPANSTSQSELLWQVTVIDEEGQRIDGPTFTLQMQIDPSDDESRGGI